LIEKPTLFGTSPILKTKVTIKMVVYAYATDGLPIYNALGQNLVVVGARTVDLDGNQIHNFRVNGEPVDGPDGAPGHAIRQPPLGDRLRFLMTMVSNTTPFAHPGGTARIAMTPARTSRDPIDYSSKTGSSLYDRATKSLFVNPKDVYDLKSEGSLTFWIPLIAVVVSVDGRFSPSTTLQVTQRTSSRSTVISRLKMS